MDWRGQGSVLTVSNRPTKVGPLNSEICSVIPYVHMYIALRFWFEGRVAGPLFQRYRPHRYVNRRVSGTRVVSLVAEASLTTTPNTAYLQDAGNIPIITPLKTSPVTTT